MSNNGRFFLGAPNAPLPPSGVYGETSIWMRLYYGDKHSVLVEGFLRTAAVQNVPVVTSNHTFREVRHVLRRQVYADEARKLGMVGPDGTGDWNYFAKNSPKTDVHRASALVEAEYQRLKGILVGYPGVIVEHFHDNDTFQRSVDGLMSKYPLDSGDAQHVAIMRSLGLNAIASTDGDYMSLENTNVYTVPKIIWKNGPIPKPILMDWVNEPWEDPADEETDLADDHADEESAD